MSPFEQCWEIREGVLKVMHQGRYYDHIMSAGPELNRVKEFLLRMACKNHAPCLPKQHPTFLPLFPGLEHRPFRDPAGDRIADYLKEVMPIIKNVALRLQNKTLSFSGGVVSQGNWKVYPLWYMGMSLPFMTMHCPELKSIAANLPRSGMLHPFSEALLSWQEAHTHLSAHCSVDALRLRYSVGIIIDAFCELRVADIKQQWRSGESIVFEDCFEHEAWNGAADRLVFIIDTWHPDLTPVEVAALMAGFRKRQVREILYEFRMSEPMRNYLRQRFIEEDQDPLLKQYWDFDAKITSPTISNWGIWHTVPVFKTES